MTAVTNIRAVEPPLPEVVGYVEAVAADRLLGWAWAPAAPDQRSMIELRLGATVIASTLADLPRPDLQGNGIGDGQHAFNITIPPEYRDRTVELRVFARSGDGAAVPIGAPPAADGLTDQVTKVLRGVDTLLNSQRLIHRNLQAALTAKPANAEGPAIVARIAELQAGMIEQISGVERFVMRLDEHLSKLTPAAAKPTSAAGVFPRVAILALAVSGTALIVSVVGLVRSLGG